MLAPDEAANEQVRPDLRCLLDTFVNVFQKPQGLPPSRLLDHAIYLVVGAALVNVKPYRYPYFQKKVREKLVTDDQRRGNSG